MARVVDGVKIQHLFVGKYIHKVKYFFNREPNYAWGFITRPYQPPLPQGKTAFSTPKSNDTELKKFDFS